MELPIGLNSEISAIHGYSLVEKAYKLLLDRIRAKKRPSPVSNTLAVEK